jgi:hypothetical protein
MYARRRGNFRTLFFTAYVVFGFYFINSFAKFVDFGKWISAIDPWMDLIGGILLILGGIFFLRSNRMYY